MIKVLICSLVFVASVIVHISCIFVSFALVSLVEAAAVALPKYSSDSSSGIVAKGSMRAFTTSPKFWAVGKLSENFLIGEFLFEKAKFFFKMQHFHSKMPNFYP